MDGGRLAGHPWRPWQTMAEDRVPLGEWCTVFQAEVIAITEALTWTKMNLDEGTRISVRSDSQAAIQAITGRTVSTKTVSECQTVLASVKETMQVRIDWIKGHADHPGNEVADALAKEANQLARDSHGPLPLAAIPVSYTHLTLPTKA